MNITISISAEEIEAIARLVTRAFLSSPAPEMPVSTEEAESLKRKRVSVRAPTLAASPITLIAGEVEWRVEVDGIPVRWQLNYPAGNLPAAQGDEVIWQGGHYRVSRVYGTSLKVTSQDADTYQSYNGRGAEVAP